VKLIIDIPKKENFGEDAPPILLSSADKKRFLVAVLDGLGGSGSTLYEDSEGVYSGAYIGSREARSTIFSYFEEHIEKDNLEISTDVLNELKHLIKEDLVKKLKKQRFEKSKLKSALIRTFPTTLALGLIRSNQNKSTIDLLWAGDSRIYTLDNSDGLIQLTKDDIKINNDPFENIDNDSPLSNMIQLDEDFTINHHRLDIVTPCFVIAATDGCFGYYPTPMHFEYLLLNTLLNSNSENEWEENITIELKKISGDDFSLALYYISNESSLFKEVKELFRMRNEILYQTFMVEILKKEAELNELSRKKDEIFERISNVKKEKKDLYKSLWAKYKITNFPPFKSED
jgi:serine/threonine protein phosphatase PrpC